MLLAKPAPKWSLLPGSRHFQPRLACDRAGRFALQALKIVGSAVHVVVFTSPPGRPRFGPERIITSQPIDPTIGPPGKNGAWWIGDVQGLAVSPHAIHPIWTDSRDGHLEAFTAIVPYAAPRGARPLIST